MFFVASNRTSSLYRFAVLSVFVLTHGLLASESLSEERAKTTKVTIPVKAINAKAEAAAEKEVAIKDQLVDGDKSEVVDAPSEDGEDVADDEVKKSSSISTDSAKREVLGWVERISLQPEGIFLDSKLTPGSEGNVLHAENIKRFKKGKKSWVSFVTLNRKGEPVSLEREVEATSTFRTTSGKTDKRIKVKSGFCLSRKYMEVEFALADRREFDHEVRIGRDALAGHFVIDPARTRTSKPSCKPNN